MAGVAGAKGFKSPLTFGGGGAGLQVGGLDAHVTALWTLLAMELLALVGLRHYFRRQHGG